MNMNTCCRASSELSRCMWNSTNDNLSNTSRDDLATRFLTKNCKKEVRLRRKHRVGVTMSSSGTRNPVQTDAAGLTYKDAGVDIDAGSELVRRIAKMAPGIGGFGGLFPLGIYPSRLYLS